MMKFLFSLLLFFSHLAWAQESLIPLLVQEAIVEGKNEAFYRAQLRKITLDTIRRYKKYEIFLSTNSNSDELSVNFLSVKISYHSNSHYLIEVQQISGKSLRVLKESWAAYVPDRFVLLQSRINLMEVLYGKGMARKLKEQLMKENPEFGQQIEAQELPIISSLEGKELPSSLSSRRDNLLNEKNSRVFNDLRKDISKELDNLTSQNESDQSFKTLDQNQVDEASDLAMISDGSLKSEDNPYGKGMRPRESSLAVDFVYLNRHLQSQYFFNVTNNINYMGPRLVYRKNLSETAGDEFVFSLMNLKAIKINNVEFDVPDLRNVHAQYLNAVSFLPFDILLGAHYDNQILINLSEINSGLKLSENHLVWVQVGVERTFNWRLLSLSLQALYAQNIFSKSSFIDNKDVKLDGNRYSVGGELLFKKVRLGVFISKEEITSRSLNNFAISQDSFFMNFAYIF